MSVLFFLQHNFLITPLLIMDIPQGAGSDVENANSKP